MKLLVQGDDYGFTKGVTYGIIEAIDNGVLTATGMFTNVEIAPWAAKFVKERPEFCFGIDFNLVSGPCVSNPEEVPNLVDENGRFIRSNIRISDPRWKTEEGRAQVYPYDEVYKEIKAQYNRFIELCGRKPGYLNGHSLICENINKAIKQLSIEEDIPLSFDFMKKFFSTFELFAEKDNVSMDKKFNAENQYSKNPLKKFIENKEELLKHEYVFMGGHPGYVDADLFYNSSLSIERARDLELVLSKEVKDFIKENDVELISYYDLPKPSEDKECI